MSVTLKDIADYSGVSVATASLALNNKPVSPITRRKVLAAAQKLGYRPSTLARGLRTRASMTIGLAMGYPHLELMNSIFCTAQARGYQVITQPFPQQGIAYDPNLELKAYACLMDRRVDGVIIWPSEAEVNYAAIMADFHRHGIPVVVVDRVLPGMNVPSFLCDNRTGSRMAWQHLYNLKRSPIIYLDHVQDCSSIRLRREGIRDAHLKNGVRWQDENLLPVVNTAGIDLDIIRKALEKAQKGGAILAATDHIAYSVLRTARQMNIRIPEDVAVLGFEDVIIWLDERVGWTTSPPLSTIRMRFDQVGAKATNHLLDILLQESPRSDMGGDKVVLVEPRLVVRNSCGGAAGIYRWQDHQIQYMEKEKY